MRHLTLPALLILTLLALAPAPPSKAQPAPAPVQLLADLNTATESSNFGAVVTLGPLLYFVRYADDGGELWSSDGSAEGTLALYRFGLNAAPSNLTAVGSTLYFSVISTWLPPYRNELWASDGTVAGTRQVQDFTGARRPLYNLAALGDQLFFFSDETLWRSDGTPDGTLPLKVFDLEAEPLAIRATTEQLFFVMGRIADNYSSKQLWVSDGSADGTLLVRDFNPQPDSGENRPFSKLRLLVTHKGALYLAYEREDSSEIWRSDGTAAGTLRLGLSIVNDSIMPSLGDGLYFAVDSQLWRGDGTPAGSVPLFDLATLPQGQSYSAIYGLTTIGSTLYFVASDSFGRGDLWRSDGSAAGTTMVFSFGDRPYYLGLALLPAANATLYMFAYDTQHGYELWHSNGTTAGTALVADLTTSGASALSTFTQIIGADTQAFFTVQRGSDSQFGTFDLWRSDGSAANTRLISSTIRLDAGATLGDRLIFTRSDQIGLWASDGTLEGTQQIDPQLGYLIGQTKGRVFMRTGTYGTNGASIIATDGTVEGTELLFFINQSVRLAEVATGVYFLYASEDGGCRMRYSDDVVEGLGPIVPLPLNCANGFAGFAHLGNRFYMMVRGSISGSTLWVSDGTSAGTTPITTLNQRLEGSLAILGEDLLFFTRGQSGEQVTLWRSDGRSAEVHTVLSLSNHSLYGSPVLSGGKLFFVTLDKDRSRWELWASDGSASGSAMLRAGATNDFGNPTISSLTAIGDLLLFAGDDGEPWLSDGTPAGTYRLHDVNPGPASANPFGFSLAGRRLFFAADDDTHGSEPWVSAPSLKLVGPTAVDAPAGLALIDLRAQEISLASDATVTLSITLDPALTYLGNDQGITPTQQGGALIFNWPVGAALRLSALGLRIGLPADAPTDKAYWVEIAAATSDPADEPADNQLSVELRRVYRLLAPIVAQ